MKKCNNSAVHSLSMVRDEKKREKEFIEIYEKYHNDIFRFCMVKLSDRETSLDITQEVFLRFWKKFLEQDTHENVRAFLYQIARNLVIDFYKKKKSIPINDIRSFEKSEDLIHEVEKTLSFSIDAGKTLFLLQKLPESMREVLTLRYLHELSISEISTITGKSPGYVSTLIHRSLKKMREIIENQ